MKPLKPNGLAAALLLAFVALWPESVCRAQAPKDILWYGNSFTNATCCGGTRSVPNIFADIVVAAGHIAPRNRNASADGQSLLFHRNSNTAVITTGILPGEKWEAVVLQDFSTMPTHIGNLTQHLSSSLSLYQAVAAHSPGVEAIMYETWARGPGHSYYTGGAPAFPGGPAQMQQELRDGYKASTANINTAIGSPVATYAPVGDAWQQGGFPANFYAGDIYHANNRGSLLNALVLYSVIYDDPTTSDINLSGVLTTLGLSAADGQLASSLADAVAVPEPSSCGLAAVGLAVLFRRRNWRSSSVSLTAA